MEYVSVLAGCRFSDHPRCTHRVLGWLARGVNDTISDTARPQLCLAAPDLIGTRDCGRGVRAAVCAELARAGSSAAPHDQWFRDLGEIAEYRLSKEVSARHQQGAPGRRWQQPVWSVDRNYAFGNVIAAMDRIDPTERDRLLIELLSASIRRARRHLGHDGALPEHAPPSPRAR